MGGDRIDNSETLFCRGDPETMTVSLEDMKKSLSVERRLKIQSRVLELEAERQAFLTIRHAWELTLKQLAETCAMNDIELEQARKRSDLMIDTLKNFVEASGGKLALTASFPQCPPLEIESLTWLEADGDQ